MKPIRNILFVGAQAFSGTGGIEQVNKSWIYTLAKEPSVILRTLVLLDAKENYSYTNHTFFKGFKGNKFTFLWTYFQLALKSEVLIISHIHLSILVPLLKILKPKLKTIIICHGIEVWNDLSTLRKAALKKSDVILAVSAFTKEKLIKKHQIREAQISVFPNALSPNFPVPTTFEKSEVLKQRYAIKENSVVLLTIARLASGERYKGYDQVIKAIPSLLISFPNLVYIIGGKADAEEQTRIEALVQANNLTQHVVLAGFIAEDEMIAHYQLANVFVMPSTGEGFGISFIESAACGTPVLGGNQDGSPEAIISGVTGELCDPTSINEIAAKINHLLVQPRNPIFVQENALNNYSFAVYQNRILNLIA